ncbi:MAG: hypothetical protein IKS19_05125 [Clostridia bacterium]|nr:hypothetical protein [Clostridia bacterium]
MKRFSAVLTALILCVLFVSCEHLKEYSDSHRPGASVLSEAPAADESVAAANDAMQSVLIPCSVDELGFLGEHSESTQYITGLNAGYSDYTVTYPIGGTGLSLRVFADKNDVVTKKQIMADKILQSDFTEKKAQGIKEGRSIVEIEQLLGMGLNILSYQAYDENAYSGEIYDLYVWENKQDMQFSALVCGGAAVSCQLCKKGEIALPDEIEDPDRQIMPQIIHESKIGAVPVKKLLSGEGTSDFYDGFCSINYGASVSDVERLVGRTSDGEQTDDFFAKTAEKNDLSAKFFFAKDGSDAAKAVGAPGLVCRSALDYELSDGTMKNEIRSYIADMLYAGMEKSEADRIIGFEGVYTGFEPDADSGEVYCRYRYDSRISTLYVLYDYSPEHTLSVRKAALEKKADYNESPWEKYADGRSFVFVG